MRPPSIRRAAVLGIALAMIAPAPASGQEPARSVSLEEALALFSRNSPELQLARGRLRSALGTGRQGRAVPNPVVSFTNEDLGEYSERYINLTQRVDFLWEAGGRARRAEGLAIEARSRFVADSARLSLAVKRAYLEAWAGAETVRAYERVNEVVGRLLDAAATRFAEGDLAGYDLRRLRVESASVGRHLVQAEVEQARAEEHLTGLVAGGGVAERLRPEALPQDAPAPPAGFDAVALAMDRRPEIRSAQAAAEAREAEVGLARRTLLAGTSVTGGLKRQSDGEDGFFFGVQIPVPLVDRRSAAADAARASAQAARTEVEWVRRIVAREASASLARLSSAGRQRALVGESGLDEAADLLRIAQIAYDEGEVGIVELLDAADTFLEAQLMQSAVRADGWLAFFELDRAVGGFPNLPETGVEQ